MQITGSNNIGDIAAKDADGYLTIINPVMHCSQAKYCKHKHCYHRFEHERYNERYETICNGICNETKYPAGCVQLNGDSDGK